MERAGMHEQTLQHVLVSANVRASQPTCLVEMRTRPLEQFPASPEEAFPAVVANPSSVRIDGVAFGFLIDPRLRPAIRLADVGANL